MQLKVKELIAHLKHHDPEALVFMQIDDEGNGYRQPTGLEADEVMVNSYEDYVFLSQYESIRELEEDYGDSKESLDFFSCIVLY